VRGRERFQLDDMKVALLSNAQSRIGLRHLPEVRRRIERNGAIRHVETHAPAEIARALDTIAADGTELLGINGGDGTTHLVLTALLNGGAFPKLPVLAILPGGTTNMTARDLNGGSLRFFDALDRFIACAAGELPVKQRHAVRARVAGEADRFGFFAGMGAIVRGIEFCHERVYSMGIRDEWASGVALLRAAWGIATREPVFAEALPLSLTLDAQCLRADANIFFVTSLSQLFLGIRPFWGTGDAPLNATLVRARARRFARHFPALLRGKPNAQMTDATGYSSWRIRQSRIDGAGAFTIDGEMYSADPTLSIDAAGPFPILPLGAD
jgi:diacylglycerol kinase family enzyme